MPSVLFVCLGNICRSPAGEGTLRHYVKGRGLEEKFLIGSCGTGGWHRGDPPDRRMTQAAAARGIPLDGTSQKLEADDYHTYDLILAADHAIYEVLHERSPSPEVKEKIGMITLFSSVYPNLEIPDPYMGGEEGFYHVMDMIEDSCRGIVNHYYPL